MQRGAISYNEILCSRLMNCILIMFSSGRREAVKSLLDNTRSRNIEIFLPRFPLSVQTLTNELEEQLNIVDGSTTLNVEHIVALKRYSIYIYIHGTRVSYG